MNTGEIPIFSKNGLLTTVLYSNATFNAPIYALEGAVEAAGSILAWLKDNMNIFDTYDDLVKLYHSVKDNGGVYFVPCFSGLFSPHWDNNARGTILGFTSSSNKGHIVRSVFEAISYRTLEILQSFEKDSNIITTKLSVDGGMTQSSEFLQTQSNFLQCLVSKPKEKEITLIGSAIAAGLEKEVQLWQNFDEIRSFIKIEKEYKNHWAEDYKKDILKKWYKAIERSKGWIEK